MERASYQTRCLIDLLDLKDSVNFYWAFNQASKAPYHNAQHVDFMLQDLAAFTSFKFGQTTQFPLDRMLMATLADAIIFHDFNHSMHLEDRMNVQNAVYAYCAYRANLNPLGPVSRDLVLALIQATEYPYNEEELEKKIGMAVSNSKYSPKLVRHLCMMMRDLDLLTWNHWPTEPEKTIAQFTGLFQELTFKHSGMNILGFLEKNGEFLRNAKYHTDFAQTLVSVRLERDWNQIVNYIKSEKGLQ